MNWVSKWNLADALPNRRFMYKVHGQTLVSVSCHYRKVSTIMPVMLTVDTQGEPVIPEDIAIGMLLAFKRFQSFRFAKLGVFPHMCELPKFAQPPGV